MKTVFKDREDPSERERRASLCAVTLSLVLAAPASAAPASKRSSSTASGYVC